MDNKRVLKLYRVVIAGLSIFLCFSCSAILGQDAKSYELLPAPDLWYNDVDGIRAGIRIRGQQPGTFEDGPHRLDFGLWLGTWIPDDPVSYYVSFTEPIPSISEFGSEGNIQIESLIRTGFQQHGLSFNKRWQQGFDELIFRNLSISLVAQNRFNTEYLVFPEFWQDKWLYLVKSGFKISDENSLGRYRIELNISGNVAGSHNNFLSTSSSVEQRFRITDFLKSRTRLFIGLATDNTAPEYLFSHSLNQYVNWVGKGLTRAKGTIPVPWMESGNFQIAGGPNLRGYTDQVVNQLEMGISPLLTSVGAFNLELDYANPLNSAINKIPVVGGIFSLRSYLFFDTGTSLGITEIEDNRWLTDVGTGFMLSLNIPDYIGNPRGIIIRYDIPLWLSNPIAGESHFRYRNVIGIGAIISI